MGREIYSDEELIELLSQKAEEAGKSLTVTDIDNNPDLPSGALYQQRFGSFNTALRLAGLETHKKSPGIDIAELDEDEVERLTERIKELFDQGLSRTDITRKLMVEEGVKQISTFDFISDEVITEKYIYGKIWNEFLSNTKGWGFFYPRDIFDASATARAGAASVQKFLDFVKEEKNRKVRISLLNGKPLRMYIHPPTDINDIKKLYIHDIEELPTENEEIIDLFIDYIGQGRSPKTLGAVIEYVMENRSQRVVCEKWGVSDTQVRKLYKEVEAKIRDIDPDCLNGEESTTSP